MLVNRGAGFIAGAASTRISELAWRGLTGKTPPRSSLDPDITIKEALTWAVVAGAVTEVSKVAINRAIVLYWQRSVEPARSRNHSPGK